MLKFKYDGLCCPNCGESNLHQERVEVFERINEDNETGVHVVVENGVASVDMSMEGNPSDRRDGVMMFFSCEHCPRRTWLSIVQHKGTTYLEQGIVKTIIKEDHPSESLESCIAAAIREWKEWNNTKTLEPV
jgi:hypothetical protein